MVRFRAVAKDLSPLQSSQTDAGTSQAPIDYVQEDLPRQSDGRCVMLTTYSYLVPRFRMNGVIPPFPISLRGFHRENVLIAFVIEQCWK